MYYYLKVTAKPHKILICDHGMLTTFELRYHVVRYLDYYYSFPTTAHHVFGICTFVPNHVVWESPIILLGCRTCVYRVLKHVSSSSLQRQSFADHRFVQGMKI